MDELAAGEISSTDSSPQVAEKEEEVLLDPASAGEG